MCSTPQMTGSYHTKIIIYDFTLSFIAAMGIKPEKPSPLTAKITAWMFRYFYDHFCIAVTS